MRSHRHSMKVTLLACASLSSAAWVLPAAAGTSLELLHGWDYNRDFNGEPERTILTIKTFQPWDYGTFFLYYDITGPFAAPDANVSPNEKGGFFGSMSFAFSIKRIGQKMAGQEWDWGALVDLHVKYELETVSRLGALHYYGLQYDLKIPHFDFVTMTSVIRDDWGLAGVDLQLGGAWQITLPLGQSIDLVFAGFFAWGLFGEGEGELTVGPDQDSDYLSIPRVGRPFFLSQPQLLVDALKLVKGPPGKIYLGVEYQIALNRYLQLGVSENVAQIMAKWNI